MIWKGVEGIPSHTGAPSFDGFCPASKTLNETGDFSRL